MENRKLNIINVFFSIGIVIGFYLPWINVNVLGLLDLVKGTGYEVASMADFILQGTSKIGLIAIYIIPIGSIAVIISEFMHIQILRLCCQILVVLTFGYLIYELIQIIEAISYSIGKEIRVINFLSHGFYLTLVGTCYYVYNLFN